jgi:hypothetical protein
VALRYILACRNVIGPFNDDLAQAEFERWTKAFRSAIDAVAEKEHRAVSQAMAMDNATATNAADLFRSAIASPKQRPKRRSSALSRGGQDTHGGTINVRIEVTST